MKILHIGLGDHLGGIETYLYKIASNIDLNEYQFDFLTYSGVIPCFYNELSAMGCRFQRVTPRRKSIFRFRREFTALLSQENYDIVHCHLTTLSFTEPIDIALKSGKKVIVHSRNGHFIGNTISKILHDIHYKSLRKKPVLKLAVSDVAGKWMFGEDANFIVLNNGVDLEKIHYTPEGRQKIRDEFNINENRLVVHIGSFRTPKNHEFLIDIFAEVHRLEPDTILMLVGSGDLEDQIKAKVIDLGLFDHVIFAGQRNDVPEILSAGDVFLFPSLYEGFPNALIEAEATGLYCLSSDTITEQAKIDGLCESLSLEKTAAEWAEKVHLINNNEDRKKGADDIRMRKLDVKSEISHLEKIYADLCK